MLDVGGSVKRTRRDNLTNSAVIGVERPGLLYLQLSGTILRSKRNEILTRPHLQPFLRLLQILAVKDLAPLESKTSSENPIKRGNLVAQVSPTFHKAESPVLRRQCLTSV